MSNGEWKLLPPNEETDYFVKNNLEPLPTQLNKRVYASFFVCPNDRTFIVAKMEFFLQVGSFITRKNSSCFTANLQNEHQKKQSDENGRTKGSLLWGLYNLHC